MILLQDDTCWLACHTRRCYRIYITGFLQAILIMRLDISSPYWLYSESTFILRPITSRLLAILRRQNAEMIWYGTLIIPRWVIEDGHFDARDDRFTKCATYQLFAAKPACCQRSFSNGADIIFSFHFSVRSSAPSHWWPFLCATILLS